MTITAFALQLQLVPRGAERRTFVVAACSSRTALPVLRALTSEEGAHTADLAGFVVRALPLQARHRELLLGYLAAQGGEAMLRCWVEAETSAETRGLSALGALRLVRRAAEASVAALAAQEAELEVEALERACKRLRTA